MVIVKKAFGASLGIGAALSLLFAAPAPASDSGKKIYDAKCTSCHKADGKGNPSMAKMFKVEPSAMDLTLDTVAKKPDSELLKVVGEGRKKMPAFAKQLKAEELKSVVEYVRTLAPRGKAAPSKAEAPASGEKKAE